MGTWPPDGSYDSWFIDNLFGRFSVHKREAALGAAIGLTRFIGRDRAGLARRIDCQAESAFSCFRGPCDAGPALFLYDSQPGGVYFAKLDGGPADGRRARGAAAQIPLHRSGGNNLFAIDNWRDLATFSNVGQTAAN